MKGEGEKELDFYKFSWLKCELSGEWGARERRGMKRNSFLTF
jgi:hypothetical protein